MNDGPFTRNKYFEGQLLTTKDFQDEQEYHNSKRRLLNRYLHGPGVVCGLEVALQDGAIVIEPGLALDCLGREIVIPERVESEINLEKMPLYLLVQYHEYESDPVPGMGDPDQVQYTRITESYKLTWGSEDPLSQHQHSRGRWEACGEDHPIPLAQVYCWENELILDEEFPDVIRVGEA